MLETELRDNAKKYVIDILTKRNGEKPKTSTIEVVVEKIVKSFKFLVSG